MRFTGPDGGRVRAMPEGPLLVDGPVRVELDDGRSVSADRSIVALCTCRRSKRYPFCDTSHRPRLRPTGESTDGPTDPPEGHPSSRSGGRTVPTTEDSL